MPAGQASMMTQTLDLTFCSIVVLEGNSHIIGFNMGVLQVMNLISSKHFWWSGIHWKGMWFVQIFCNGPVYAPIFGKNHTRYSMSLRNLRTSVWSLGMCQFL